MDKARTYFIAVAIMWIVGLTFILCMDVISTANIASNVSTITAKTFVNK